MEQAKLNKILDEHKKWLITNGKEGQRADLSYADLRSANLSCANLDYSAFPLWCGGLDVNIDDRQATQLLYHLIRNVNYICCLVKKVKCLLYLLKMLIPS